MKDQMKAGSITVLTALIAGFALAAFVFAGAAYIEERFLDVIVINGLLSAVLLAVQTLTFQPRTWNLRTTILTIVVGLSTHYSALIVGVSYVGAYQQGKNAEDLIAVLVMQAVLTGAACIMVYQFQRNNAVRCKTKCCCCKPAGS